MAWTTLTKRAIGYLITKASDVDLWIDDLNFLHTRPRGLWVPPGTAEGTGVVFPSRYNFIHSAELVDNQDDACYLTFAVPTEYTILSKAVIVLIAAGTGNLKRSVETQYGANGQAYNTHTGSVADGLVAVTSGQFKEIDISGALATLAAGDYAGVQFNRNGLHVNDTVGASVHVLGVWIEYY